MMELSDNTDAAAKSLETLEKRLQGVADETQRLNTLLEQNARIDISKLKAGGATDEKIFAAQQDALKKKRALLIEELKLISEEESNFKKQNTVTKQRSLPGGGTATETVINETKDYYEGLSKIRIEYNKNEQALNEVNTQLIVNDYSFQEQQRNKNIASAKKHADDIKQLTEKEAKAALDLYKFRKEQQIKEQQLIAGNGINGINARIAATERIAELQKDIVVAEYNYTIRYGQLTNAGLLLQFEQRAAKEKEILDNSLRDMLQLRLDYAQKFKEADAAMDATFYDENSTENKIAAMVAGFERRKAILERNAADEATQNENARAAGIISEEQYAYKRIKIEEELALAILKEELYLAEKKLAILKATGVDTVQAEKEIAEIRRQIAEKQNQQANETDNTKSGTKPIEKQIDKVKELRDAWFDLGQTLKDTVFAVLTRGFEQAKNDLQDQIDLIDIRKAKDIEAVNASTASAQDKADRIKIIEATAQTRRDELERRQRQIDMEKARFERTAQAASIIGNTAKAITAALPNVPLSIIAGAIGALQLATLYATPLPKYLHGKKDNYEGWATVSEDGRPELYVDHNTGTIGLTPAKPSMMYVTKESSIIPAGKVNDYLRYSGMGSVPMLDSSTASVQQGGFSTDMNIVNAIKSKKMSQVVVVNNNLGWYDHIKTRVFK